MLVQGERVPLCTSQVVGRLPRLHNPVPISFGADAVPAQHFSKRHGVARIDNKIGVSPKACARQWFL